MNKNIETESSFSIKMKSNRGHSETIMSTKQLLDRNLRRLNEKIKTFYNENDTTCIFEIYFVVGKNSEDND